MRIKETPEDFVVREAFRFEKDKRGDHYVYLMDKQKLSTLEAVDRLAKAHEVPTRDISFCGLKDKQGRTEQIIAIRGRRVEHQEPDLRLKLLGRTGAPLSAANLTANRFVVTVRDLSIDEAERVPASVEEVRRLGVVNYFDSQRFGGLKHGQGFIARELAFGRIDRALRAYLAKPSALDRSDDAKVKAFWHLHWGDWSARCPYAAVARYRPVLKRLRADPDDWLGALKAIDRRRRALWLFEYQSFLWNESVRRYLLGRLGPKGELVLRYQAGVHLFPRTVADTARVEALAKATFPLVGPTSTFDDPEIEKAVQDTLTKEKLGLERLGIPAVPGMGMKHELRRLVVFPGKLSVVHPRPDERHRGRVKVTLAFTLPSGAYATLVVRRTLWFAQGDVISPGGPLPEPQPGFVPQRVLERVRWLSSRGAVSRRRPSYPSRGVAVEDAAKKRQKKPARDEPGREKPARDESAREKPGREKPARDKPREAKAPGRKPALGDKVPRDKAPDEKTPGKKPPAKRPARKRPNNKRAAKKRPSKGKVHRKGQRRPTDK